MTTWNLQDAQNHLSEVVHLAQSQEEQVISVRGKPVVTVIATEELHRLRQQPINMADFLLHSPLQGLDIHERN